MRKIVAIILICYSTCILSKAQISDFDKAYQACLKINEGFADGYADAEMLSEAASILESLSICALPIELVNGKNNSLNGHVVFTADFIKDCIQNEEIYRIADEYANKDTNYRGAILMMSTICIDSGDTSIYQIQNCYNDINIGCVSETNGMFSWSIKIKNPKTNEISIISKGNDIDEKKGRAARIEKIRNQRGFYTIEIDITNTSDAKSSFVIIAQ